MTALAWEHDAKVNIWRSHVGQLLLVAYADRALWRWEVWRPGGGPPVRQGAVATEAEAKRAAEYALSEPQR